MKQRNKNKKLGLNLEKLKQLDPRHLAQAAGGATLLCRPSTNVGKTGNC
jgi:hypothetical protein